MEAIGLFFSKFSEELLSAQIALLSLSLALAVYWMLVRKKKRETAEWVPAALVREYLDRMRADERETRIRLFGDSGYPAPVSTGMPLTQMISSAAGHVPVPGTDPALAREVEALRSQLGMADARAMEADRAMNGLRAEKAAFEQKIKDAAALAASATPGAAAPAGAPPAATLKELEDLRAKLQEYEVIEDDLADLKKFQKENEQLRQKVSQLEGGAPAVATIAASAPPPPEAATTIPNATQKIETPVTVISGGPAKAAEPAPASPAPAPAVTAPPSASEANTNVLAPVTPTVDSGAGVAEKSSKQKEAELLSEFEKMLAS
jgi:hypothetical protein